MDVAVNSRRLINNSTNPGSVKEGEDQQVVVCDSAFELV
jgi:hypothetical protein